MNNELIVAPNELNHNGSREAQEQALAASLPSARPVSIGDYVSPDAQISQNHRSHFDPLTASRLSMHDDEVKRCGQYLSDLEARQQDRLPAYNQSNHLFNEAVRENESELDRRKEALEPTLAELRQQRTDAQGERDTAEVDLRAAQSELSAREAHIEKTKEDAKAMNFPATKEPGLLDHGIEWFARIALGGVMALSLGLLTGTISPYRLLSWKLLPMFAIAMAVVTLTGASVKWLARENSLSSLEANRQASRTERRWAWFLIGFGLFAIIVDASVTLYGVFRAISEGTILGNAGEQAAVPLLVLFACTTTFILPYVVFETSLGHRIGKFLHTNMAAARVAHEASGMDPEMVTKLLDLRVRVDSLNTKLDHANQKVSRIEAEIDRVKSSVLTPLYVPPPCYTGLGVITHGALPQIELPMKGRTHILPLVEPPITEDIVSAGHRLDEAVGERNKAYAAAYQEIRDEQKRQRDEQLRLERQIGLISRMRRFWS